MCDNGSVHIYDADLLEVQDNAESRVNSHTRSAATNCESGARIAANCHEHAFPKRTCPGGHVLGGADVSRIRLSECGLIDLFAEDVAVTCVPGELLDHGEQCPSHADVSLAGIVLGVVEVEAGRDHA